MYNFLKLSNNLKCFTGERVALKVVDCVSDEKRREVLAECLVLRRFCSPIHPKDDNPSDSALSQQHPCLPLFFGAFLERFSSDRGVATERVLIAMEAIYCLQFSITVDLNVELQSIYENAILYF